MRGSDVLGLSRWLVGGSLGLASSLLAIGLMTSPATAVITASSGYIYGTLGAGGTTQSCVAAGPGGTFVGVGPGFAANANSILHVSESGATRTVATGFNSISDCAYDAATNILYVGDNAGPGDIMGAVTGDTVFAIDSASTATNVPAAGNELAPANSLPAIGGLVVESNGNLLAAEATGPGAGAVRRINVGSGSVSTFASGFDYASGVAISPSGANVLVAETTASFESLLSRFDTTGAFLSTLAGPSFAFGSYDLAYTHDGLLVATGSGSLAAFNSVGSASPFASGFTFPSGISVDGFSGRVEVLDSFSGSANDSTLHRFTPIAKLLPGGSQAKYECFHEFYGVELVAAAPGKTPRTAICVDGEACDDDGAANGSCVFPVGLCFRVGDPRFPECAASDVSEVSIRATPSSTAFDTFAANVQAALPISASACFFSDGVTVPVKTTTSGVKPGRGSVKVKTEVSTGKRDSDTVRLLCQPAP